MDSMLLGIVGAGVTYLVIDRLADQSRIDETQRKIDENNAFMADVARDIARERGITIEEAMALFKTKPGPVEQWLLGVRQRVMEFIQRR